MRAPEAMYSYALSLRHLRQRVEEGGVDSKVDEVWMVYNHFYSTVSQKPVVVKLLPIEPDRSLVQSGEKKERKSRYIFESGKKALLNLKSN